MRKAKQSKFVGKEFDNGWVCTGINIARATLTHKNGGPTYWYAMARKTSDGKFDKWIRIEGHEASKVYKGLITVEEICEARESAVKTKSKHSVNYQFIGRR